MKLMRNVLNKKSVFSYPEYNKGIGIKIYFYSGMRRGSLITANTKPNLKILSLFPFHRQNARPTQPGKNDIAPAKHVTVPVKYPIACMCGIKELIY